jgi:hypothetical protein
MLRPVLATLAACGALLATPASATYLDITYTGSVAMVGDGAAAAGLSVGTPITFEVFFNPDKLVDYTAAFTASNGGDPAGITSLKTASLSDDSYASLTIKVGDVSFTKFDGIQYGTPCGDDPADDCAKTGGLAVGNLPSATYLGGKFAGVGNIFINKDGYSLDADPVADTLLRYYAGNAFGLDGPAADDGTGGTTLQDFDFYLGKGDLDNPFTTGLAVGNIDISSATITTISAVPEPASWAMMIGGIGLVGGVSRRRAKVSRIAFA